MYQRQLLRRTLIALFALASVLAQGCVGDDRRDADDRDDGAGDRTGLIYGYTYLGSIQEDVKVTLADNHNPSIHFDETVSDHEGYFELEVVPGTYTLLGGYIAWDYYGAPDCADQRVDVEVGADEGVQQDIHLICADVD